MQTNSSSNDNFNLLRTVKQLCTTHVRDPLDFEKIKRWLNQFEGEEERRLGLLILRFLVFRTSKQMVSSLRQGLQKAARHYHPNGIPIETTHWKDILTGEAGTLKFYFGPPSHEFSPPGKRGDLVTRLVRECITVPNTSLINPASITNLSSRERFIIVDDASYTGEQLIDFFSSTDGIRMLRNIPQVGIVLGLAHTKALDALESAYPQIPVFYGELITEEECFERMAQTWVVDGWWGYDSTTPFDLYMDIVDRKAKFQDPKPLGFGSIGCMVAFWHLKAPDDALQLLWGRSETWEPLFER